MLVNGSDFYCGNSSLNPLQLALKSMIPDVSGFATTSELNSLKSSVSNGKSLIASAITGKGVSTDAGASFQTMANNIGAIPVGFSSVISSSTGTTTTMNYKGDNDMTSYSKYAALYMDEGRNYGYFCLILVDRASRSGYVAWAINDYHMNYPYPTYGYFGPADLYNGKYYNDNFILSKGGDSLYIAGALNVYLYGMT